VQTPKEPQPWPCRRASSYSFLSKSPSLAPRQHPEIVFAAAVSATIIVHCIVCAAIAVTSPATASFPTLPISPLVQQLRIDHNLRLHSYGSCYILYSAAADPASFASSVTALNDKSPPFTSAATGPIGFGVDADIGAFLLALSRRRPDPFRSSPPLAPTPRLSAAPVSRPALSICSAASFPPWTTAAFRMPLGRFTPIPD
ncbi:hypothetical protein Vafri_6595, partial [Volvox africanus]